MVYVIGVMTGKEKESAQDINDLKHPDIIKAYNPESVLNKPVFPGYIFVRMKFTGRAYYAIRNMPYVLYFLSPTYGVFPLSDKETGCLEQNKQTLIGLRVTVTCGRYQGITGTVREVAFPNAVINLPLGVSAKVNIKSLVLNNGIALGASVRVTSGAYAGLTGTVEAISNSTALIRAQAFGVEAIVECPAECLEEIS